MGRPWIADVLRKHVMAHNQAHAAWKNGSARTQHSQGKRPVRRGEKRGRHDQVSTSAPEMREG